MHLPPVTFSASTTQCRPVRFGDLITEDADFTQIKSLFRQHFKGSGIPDSEIKQELCAKYPQVDAQQIADTIDHDLDTKIMPALERAVIARTHRNHILMHFEHFVMPDDAAQFIAAQMQRGHPNWGTFAVKTKQTGNNSSLLWIQNEPNVRPGSRGPIPVLAS